MTDTEFQALISRYSDGPIAPLSAWSTEDLTRLLQAAIDEGEQRLREECRRQYDEYC